MKDIDLNNLDLSNIGAWPTAVKIAIIVVVSAAAAVAGFFLDIQNQIEKLERAERQEITLKSEFENKQSKAVNLEAYKQQLTEGIKYLKNRSTPTPSLFSVLHRR